jgi:hypothetical protein
MPKKKNDPIYNSRPYQWLIKKEQEGVFNRGPSLDDSAVGKKVDAFIGKGVKWVKDKLHKKRKVQAGMK